jgi:hypothetical protein
MPLLFDKKNDDSFSNFLVAVKVSPVADENLAVYSCSSDNIGLFNFFSPLKPVPFLLDPDLADGANLIYLPVLPGLPYFESGDDYNDSFIYFLLASSSS